MAQYQSEIVIVAFQSFLAIANDQSVSHSLMEPIQPNNINKLQFRFQLHQYHSRG